jgi:hypothetical protein
LYAMSPRHDTMRVDARVLHFVEPSRPQNSWVSGPRLAVEDKSD